MCNVPSTESLVPDSSYWQLMFLPETVVTNPDSETHISGEDTCCYAWPPDWVLKTHTVGEETQLPESCLYYTPNFNFSKMYLVEVLKWDQ